MFGGDSVELGRVIGAAMRAARDSGVPRVGSEHLLLALTTSAHPVADVLVSAGATEHSVWEMVRVAGPEGAGPAADRLLLRHLGLDLDVLVASGFSLDRSPEREPRWPMGARPARRRCAAMSPALGLDAQAAYEASLRLALARRERQHRPEHLALVLVAIDPGARWVLDHLRIDAERLVDALAAGLPPPRRGALLRLDRRLGGRGRGRVLLRRYQHTAGRAPVSPAAVPSLVMGSTA